MDTIVLDPGIDAIDSHRFRAGSVFDPDFETGGHQPMGFDEAAAEYQHYAVYNSTLKATFMPKGSAGVTANMVVGAVKLQGSSALVPTNVQHLLEGERTDRKIVLDKGKYATVTKNYDARRFFCRSDTDLPTALTALTSTNPADEAYYHVCATGTDTITDPGQVQVLVEIEYYVKFYEPKAMVQS